MGIPRPKIQLNIRGKYHTEKIGKMFKGLQDVIRKDHYDYAIVFGDVNSTLAGALAAIKKNVRLIHVEAGLRSHDRRMPEEINRVIVDHISDLLFTTEPSANDNLKLEGIEDDKVKYVGNIMIESIELFRHRIEASKILSEQRLNPKKYVVATVHRQENIDNKFVFSDILHTLNKVSQEYNVVLPLHPGTQKMIKEYNLDNYVNNIKIIPPLGYFDFMNLMINAKGVITDSGGIQEETSHLGIPCATLRDNTERPITIELGTNKLFSFQKINGIAEEILLHINNVEKKSDIPLWDDKVSERIFDYLKKIL